MPLSQISAQTNLGDILVENSFTLGQLHGHPLSVDYATGFDDFQTQWAAANTTRTSLVIALGKANGALYAADDGIDDFIDLLDRTLLILTKNDRTAPLYAFYFEGVPAHVLKRPILGEELTTVRGFLPSLESSPHPSLAALAPTLAALVTKADAAVAAQVTAEQALKDFDMLGTMRTLIDTYNVLRQTVYGQLAALPHANPAAMLPANFADRFFRHESRRGIGTLRNQKDVQQKIELQQKKLEASQKHLESLAAAAAQKLADKKAAQDAMAAVQQAKLERKAADEKLKELEREAKAAKDKAK